MKEEKEKAQERVYLRIEKCVLAYSVTSDASQRRDASAFCLAKHRDATRDATRHVVRSIIWNESNLLAN